MEKKFESELGKRIVEGKKRVSSKKAILAMAAICASALLFGATLTTFAVGVNSPVEITEISLFEPAVVDTMVNVNDVDTDLKRTMSIKYRSTLPPGMNDPGNTKLIYSLNMQVKAIEGYDFATMVVGEMAAVFTTPVDAQITVNCAVQTSSGTFDAQPETISALATTSIEVSALVPAQLITFEDQVNEDGTITQVEVLKDYVVAEGDSMSWTITVVMLVPNVHGSLNEVAWPGIYEDIANTAAF